MVNNQIEFNKKHPKEVKVIKIETEDFEEQQLNIEDYPNLEKLYLYDVKDVEKVNLKNLPKLQECTIWYCGVKELVIENCLQIKKLNVRANLLTSLEFLKDLDNLEELEIDGNTALINNLEPYYNENGLDWKTYQKAIQGSNENIQELLKNIQNLKEENKKLKENLPITIDSPNDFQEKYQSLKKFLSLLSSEEQKKTEEINLLKTDELKKQAGEKLFSLKKSNKELEKKIASFERLYFAKKEKIKQKEEELEILRREYAKKTKSSFRAYSEKKIEEKIRKILKFQRDMVHCNNSLDSLNDSKKEIEEKLVQKTRLSTEELDKICQLQAEITQLSIEIQKSFNQINIDNRTINQQIKYIQGINVEGNHVNLTNARVERNTMETITYEEEVIDTELQAAIEASSENKYLN